MGFRRPRRRNRTATATNQLIFITNASLATFSITPIAPGSYALSIQWCSDFVLLGAKNTD